MGATQAGIILGSRDWIRTIMGHPLARALRADKLTLAGLEATLRLYRDLDRDALVSAIPVLRYLCRSEETIRDLARRLMRYLKRAVPHEAGRRLEIIRQVSLAGGGSLPEDNLPSWCVALKPGPSGPRVEEIAAQFRSAEPAVFGRIHEGALLFDLRTVEIDELRRIADAAATIFGASYSRALTDHTEAPNQ